ncbi:MAG: hypothetical protein CYG59_24575 [Chloroflexi bacterium]|nr:MAG: hypothetical protein CYG59_24575 [Chloroflexota bacterium]
MTFEATFSIDITMLPALPAVCHLVHRTYQLRQHALLTMGLDLDPETTAQLDRAAAEHSVALLLQAAEPIFNLLPPAQPVSLTDRLAVALSALDGLARASTPTDICRPTVSNQVQRVCIVPAQTARLAVQATLAVVLAALADDALQMVVTMPRAVDGSVLIEVESDTFGITSPTQQIERERVVVALAAVHGELSLEPRQHSSIARIWLPDQADLDKAPGLPLVSA